MNFVAYFTSEEILRRKHFFNVRVAKCLNLIMCKNDNVFFSNIWTCELWDILGAGPFTKSMNQYISMYIYIVFPFTAK